MEDFSAHLASEVQLLVKPKFVSFLHILLLGHSQASDDPLHVSLVTSAQAQIKPVPKLYLMFLPLIFLEGSSLKAGGLFVPNLPLGFLFDLHADNLMRVNSICCKFPQTECAFNAVLLQGAALWHILTKVEPISLPLLKLSQGNF